MEPPRPIKPRSWSDLDWYEEARLSPAVYAGGFVFVSGCTGANLYPDDPKAQIRQAYRYVAEVLAEAGSSWDDVVSIETLHVDMRRYIDDVLKIHHDFIKKEPFPAWTALGVVELYEPEAIFEVSVVARAPHDA